MQPFFSADLSGVVFNHLYAKRESVSVLYGANRSERRMGDATTSLGFTVIRPMGKEGQIWPRRCTGKSFNFVVQKELRTRPNYRRLLRSNIVGDDGNRYEAPVVL